MCGDGCDDRCADGCKIITNLNPKCHTSVNVIMYKCVVTSVMTGVVMVEKS